MRPEPAAAIASRALRTEGPRLATVTAIAAVFAAVNVIGYRHTYADAAARARFAAAFGDNPALRLFSGVPHDLASVGGFVEFRLVGILSVLLAGWAVFAAVRALRADEDAGRFELILAGTVTRRAATATVLAALSLECGVLWLACAATLAVVGGVPGDLTAGQTVLLAAAITGPALVFAAFAALACQVVPTARDAQIVGGALVAGSLLLRIAADVAETGWLRWATPFGWAENVRPVTGSSPAALIPMALVAVVAGSLAAVIAGRRDVATGLLPSRTPRSHLFLLGTPTQAATRAEAPAFTAWLAGVGVFAFAVGAFSRSIAHGVRAAHIGLPGVRIATATGYLALVFVFFALVVSLFAASHVHAIRDEEGSGRLETLIALPVNRRVWLAWRLAVAALATIGLALAIGGAAWAGAASRGAGVGAAGLVEAGANCAPAALLLLGVGALLFAVMPRLSAGGSFALVGVAFLWELAGGLLGAPAWVTGISPFHHLAAVPVEAYDVRAGIVMTAGGGLACAVAVALFGRRDLRGS